MWANLQSKISLALGKVKLRVCSPLLKKDFIEKDFIFCSQIYGKSFVVFWNQFVILNDYWLGSAIKRSVVCDKVFLLP